MTKPCIPPPPTKEEAENLRGWSEFFGLAKDIAEVGADIVSDTAEDADVAAAGQLDKVIDWMDNHGVKKHVPQEPALRRWAQRLRRT